MEMETAAKWEFMTESAVMLHKHYLVLRTLSEMCSEQVDYLFGLLEEEMALNRPLLPAAQRSKDVTDYRRLLEGQLAHQEPLSSNIERPPLFW